jgi:glycosyltransferase involved in cell wall biosynthesis
MIDNKTEEDYMRIALLNHGFPPDVGGGETQAYITAATLKKHGHDVHVFTGKGAKKPRKYPFSVTYLEHFKAFEKGEEGTKYFVKELKDVLTRAGQFDIIYCSNFSALQAIGYMRDLLNAKIVFTFHCVPAEEQKKVIGHFNDWDLEKSFVRSVLAATRPEITICPSKFFHRWAKEFGLQDDSIKVILNSVILEDFAVKTNERQRAEWRKKNGLPSTAFVFLTPARMLPKKGIYELVQAAKNAPENAYFYIVSSKRNANPEFLKKIEQYIEANGLSGKVQIHYDEYSVPDMPRLYQMSDALLLPSHHEGLPVTILEAMASKKLVLSSDLPALQEVVKNDTNALTCPPKDVRRLGEMISRAIDLTPDQLQTLVANGYKTVVEKADADKNMRQLEAIFRGL